MNVISNTGIKPNDNLTSDMALLGVMVTAGADALASMTEGRGDDDFTEAEIEEMLVISVTNNINKGGE